MLLPYFLWCAFGVDQDRKNGASRGFAFINYSRREDAQRAIDTLDGHGYGHLILRVEVMRSNHTTMPYLPIAIVRVHSTKSLVYALYHVMTNSGQSHAKNVKKKAVVVKHQLLVQVALVDHEGCNYCLVAAAHIYVWFIHLVCLLHCCTIFVNVIMHYRYYVPRPNV
jgi:hypothetical protein